MQLRLLGKRTEGVSKDLQSPKTIYLRTFCAVSPLVVTVLQYFFVDSLENTVFTGQKRKHSFWSIPPAKPVPTQSRNFILHNDCDSVLLTEILPCQIL